MPQMSRIAMLGSSLGLCRLIYARFNVYHQTRRHIKLLLLLILLLFLLALFVPEIQTNKQTKLIQMQIQRSEIIKKCNNEEKRSMCILMEFRPNRAQRTRGHQCHKHLKTCCCYYCCLIPTSVYISTAVPLQGSQTKCHHL